MLSWDHFVIGCLDLETGRAWMEDALGLPSSGGGRHPDMGTHNALWRVGAAYLEVIAIDPDAAPPAHPRWYGLDAPETQARLGHGPTLLTWVARSTGLEEDAARATYDIGHVRTVSRGPLTWQITVPADGRPPASGKLPALIHWPSDAVPPSASLPHQDIQVASFTAALTEAEESTLAILGARHLLRRGDHAEALRLAMTSPMRTEPVVVTSRDAQTAVLASS